MTESIIAIDSVAAIEFLHPDRPTPPPFESATALLLPLPVVGELRFGAENAAPDRRSRMLRVLDDLIASATVIAPASSTLPYYVEVRREITFASNMSRRRESHLLNDLWIAALCLEHRVPLLTRDEDFSRLAALTCIGW